METQYLEPPTQESAQYAELRLDLIEPSKTNPRKRFDNAAIAELTLSVAKVGVLQPILVREHPDNPIKYEIVAGECRWRAAQQAGLEHIPATIRSLTDLEALELQVLENLHRNDLHPLEEAEGFQQLLDANGYTVETLAEKVGKSKAAIYASLKLCALCPEGRQAFYDGKLTASTALLIARIPGAALQAKAVKEITKPNYNGDLPSYRDAARTIRYGYTLDLDRAVFDPSDATLRPGAGDCYSCEKRSGNCRELFPDIDSADVCTDPSCFQTKRAAHIDKLSQDPMTIKGEAAKELMPHGNWYVAGNRYALADRRPDNQKKTWEELLGDELPARHVIVDGRDPVKVVDIEAATRLLEERGLIGEEDPPLEPTAEELEHARKRAEKKAAEEAELNRRKQLFSTLHHRLGDSETLQQVFFMMVLPMLLVELWTRISHVTEIMAIRGDGEVELNEQSDLDEYVKKLDTVERFRFLTELAASALDEEEVFHLRWNWMPGEQDDFPNFYAILRAAGIDPEQPLETPSSPTSAAHAEQETCAEPETPEPAAQAGGSVAQPEETHIEAAVPAAPRKRGRPRKQAVLTPAAEVVE